MWANPSFIFSANIRYQTDKYLFVHGLWVHRFKSNILGSTFFINTRISFLLRDSTLFLSVLLEVGATVDMRVVGGVGVLYV